MQTPFLRGPLNKVTINLTSQRNPRQTNITIKITMRVVKMVRTIHMKNPIRRKSQGHCGSYQKTLDRNDFMRSNKHFSIKLTTRLNPKLIKIREAKG